MKHWLAVFSLFMFLASAAGCATADEPIETTTEQSGGFLSVIVADAEGKRGVVCSLHSTLKPSTP